MKILYFNYLYDIWGISIGSTIKGIELMNGLKNLGYEVKIYWRNRQPEEIEKSHNGNSALSLRVKLKGYFDKYLHEPNQYLSNLKYLIEENRILRAEKPNLLISRLDAYFISSILLAKYYKIPLVLEVDSPEVYEYATFHPQYWKLLWLLRIFEKLNIRLADVSFTVSNLLKSHFVHRGVNGRKLHVITNGADVDRFKSIDNISTVINKYHLSNHLVIGFVGSFHYWHGVDNLITLIDQTIRFDHSVKFLMVGNGGPMRPAIKKYIAEHGLEEIVILTGFVPHDDVPQYVSAMDIVLAPYPNLNFFYYSPVKIYEYMACGKPVVTSKLGQIAEIITNGENGFLCNPGNINDMSEKIFLLIEDAHLRLRMGQRARELIVANHTWHQKAKELIRLCQQAVKKDRRN